jgi:hypothetical protein
VSINKVEGPGGVRGTAPTRKAGKASGTGNTAFSQHLQEESVSGASGVSSLASASGVNPLIGLQEVGDATERAAKGKKRANNLLTQLDELRLALLGGNISKEQLMRLANMVQSQRETIDDPGLAQILDDVDLRVRVELAKYGF